MGGRVAGGVLTALLLAAPAAGQVTLRAEAGLGHVARAGRWLPVRLFIANAGGPLATDIVAAWGDARAHLDGVLAGATPREIEIYLRTMDPRATIAISVVANGRLVATSSVPLQLATADSPMTLCIESSAAASCDAFITAAELPRSWRGLDAADQLIWPAGDAASLSDAQRRALREWRTFHVLEDIGQVPPPLSAPPDPVARGSRVPSTEIAVALLLLATAVFGVPQLTLSATWRFAAIAGAAALGACGSVYFGRLVHRPIVVSQTTIVQQFAGTTDAMVSMHASVELPAETTIALRPSIGDASLIGAADRNGRTDAHLDPDGTPMFDASGGLGARRTFSLEAATSLDVLGVTREGRRVQIVSRSHGVLGDCHAASGFDLHDLASLATTGRADLDVSADDEVIVACSLRTPPVSFSAERGTVVSTGTSLLLYHVPPHATAELTAVCQIKNCSPWRAMESHGEDRPSWKFRSPWFSMPSMVKAVSTRAHE